MSILLENLLFHSLPETLSPSLAEVFFEPLRAVIEGGDFTRACPVIDDQIFVQLCVLRVLQSSKSGRDFIQVHGIPNLPGLTRANYFDGLASPRRLELMTATLNAMCSQHLPGLRAHDDFLVSIPELKDLEIWAMDGHVIAHATHDSRNAKDAYSPVSAIYKQDLRTGWTGFVDLMQPTERGVEHDITTLKRMDKEELRCGAPKGKMTIINYDAAIVDFQFSYNLKQTKSIYTLTMWKENLVPLTVMDRAIDRTNPVNALVLSDETVYFNNTPGVWRRITAINPDGPEPKVTLTNQMTLPSGALNQCRRLRWNIEKSFNQQEQKLDERKAWSTSENGKRIQAIAICIAHNLLKLFNAKLKSEYGIVDKKVICAWQKDLEKRVIAAHKAGRPFPKNIYSELYRPTEVSLQFIRWLRSGLFNPTCYRGAVEKLGPLMEKYI